MQVEVPGPQARHSPQAETSTLLSSPPRTVEQPQACSINRSCTGTKIGPTCEVSEIRHRELSRYVWVDHTQTSPVCTLQMRLVPLLEGWCFLCCLTLPGIVFESGTTGSRTNQAASFPTVVSNSGVCPAPVRPALVLCRPLGDWGARQACNTNSSTSLAKCLLLISPRFGIPNRAPIRGKL